VSLEEVLAHRDVLDGYKTDAWLVLGDRIDKRGWIPVVNAIEKGGQVEAQ
jgi:hypothetical protein